VTLLCDESIETRGNNTLMSVLFLVDTTKIDSKIYKENNLRRKKRIPVEYTKRI
jgi:hypothetical protein